MKVKISFPWASEKAVGETVSHYGVAFTVESTETRLSVVVADLPDGEALAMIEAGRAVAVEVAEPVKKAKTTT